MIQKYKKKEFLLFFLYLLIELNFFIVWTRITYPSHRVINIKKFIRLNSKDEISRPENSKIFMVLDPEVST